MDPSSERPLLARLRRGDPAAFEEAYARHGPRIFNFLARMTGNRELAEDLHQETWIKLAVHAHRLTEETDLGAWLYTVARNVARSHLRTAKATPRTEAFQHDAAHDGPSPLEWAAASETEARVERALLEIPLPFREILLLVVVEGLDHDKVARVLGLTGEAVRQRLARARAKLGERLGERFLPARSTLTEDPDAA